MNRREALAALMALPVTARLSVAEVKPTDVIVVECDELLSQAVAVRIRADLQQVWPGRKVVVCDRGLRIKIARSTDVNQT